MKTFKKRKEWEVIGTEPRHFHFRGSMEERYASGLFVSKLESEHASKLESEHAYTKYRDFFLNNNKGNILIVGCALSYSCTRLS